MCVCVCVCVCVCTYAGLQTRRSEPRRGDMLGPSQARAAPRHHCPPAAPSSPRALPAQVLNRHDNPWWLARPAVLAYLMVGVVCPTLIPRSLRAVARFSSFSVCMLFVLATAIAGLAAAAVAEGRVAPGVHLLPAAAALGPSPFQMLNNILTVISGGPVLCLPACPACPA